MNSWYLVVADYFYIIFIEYLIIAGIAFIVFYLLFRRHFLNKKIQPKFPKFKDYQREILNSLLTIVIFALVAGLINLSPLVKYAKYYSRIDDMGWGYWFFSLVVMLVLHDTWFYWTHRLMHHKRLFKLFHLTHHKSTNPTGWAAYSFDIPDAILNTLYSNILVFIMSLHYTVIISWAVTSLTLNVYGHLGFELLPKNFTKHKVGKWFNTSVHHNMHHKFFNDNYSLYFTFWDRVMGTLHPEYDNYFEQVVARRKKAAASENIPLAEEREKLVSVS